MPLTPADIHNVEFAKASLGKRGYDEEQVDSLLDEITQEMIKLLEENDVLQRRTEEASASNAVDDLTAELASARREPLACLSPREHDVLKHIAEGRSNAAIAARVFITEKVVSKYINNIFAKLGMPPSDDDNRRVLAVLTFLDA